VRGAPKLAKSPAAVCDARHGLSNPRMLVIACRCEGCEGELHADGTNAIGTLCFLICTTCRCAYTIEATKEIRR
jgi:hypothetical protein